MSRYLPYIFGALLWRLIVPVLVFGWWFITTFIICGIAYAFLSPFHPVVGILAAVLAAAIWLTPQIMLYARFWYSTHGQDAPRHGIPGFMVNPPGYILRKIQGE